MLEIKRIDRKVLLCILEILTLTAVACMALSEFGAYYLIVTTFGRHSRIFRKIAFGLFVTKILLTRYEKKEFGMVLGLSAIGYLNYHISGNGEIILSIAMLLSLKNVSLKKVFATCFFCILSMVLLMGGLSIAGVKGQVAITKSFRNEGIETRYCFGYHHPNQWAHAMYLLMLTGVLTFWKKINWKSLIGMFVLNLLIYRFSISRTGFLCGLVMICMIIFYKYGGKIAAWKPLNYLISLGSASIWMIALFLISENSFAGILREKLYWYFTGRLSMAREFLLQYPIRLWGSQIPDTLSNGMVLDFGYARFLLENGTLIYFLMFFAMIFLGISVVKKEQYPFLIAIVCTSLYGMYENVAMKMVPANVVMILFALLIYPEKKENRGKMIKQL